MTAASRRGVFVTGTDTGVGKTVVAALLAAALTRRGLDVGVMKPFATGDRRDAQQLIQAAGVSDPIALVNPCYFRAPAAPWVASRAARMPVQLDHMRRAYRELQRRHDWLVVEGVGGLCVPITERYWVLDLADELGLPLLIVARASLGTINHTLLTVQAARRRGLAIAGLIINCDRPPSHSVAEKTSPSVLRQLTGLPLLGELPWRSHLWASRNGGPVSWATFAERHIKLSLVSPELAYNRKALRSL